MSDRDGPGGPGSRPDCRPAVVARLRAAGCVFAEDEARLLLAAARTLAELEDLVARRVAGKPLEHVVGWADFCGLRIAVDPGVFVPRRRSEFLAQQATGLLAAGETVRAVRSAAVRVVGTACTAHTVVDLCCGTGAVGVAVTTALQQGTDRVELHAVDLDPGAVRCAWRNVAAVGGRVHEGDLWAALPAGLRGRVDVVVASAPYVPSGEIDLLPAEARLHEPRMALDGGTDGLDVIRRVIAEAPSWLSPGGWLLMDMGHHQAASAADALAHVGLIPQVVGDLELSATVVIGANPTP